MTAQATDTIERRVPLTRERVLRTAVARADQGGLEALTMRKLGQELGVEAMALYHHFANKNDLIDGMVDLVFSEIELPESGPDWRSAMRRRAIAVRDALLRHRWAIGLMESRRTPGPANLRHHDAVIGNLRAGGFDIRAVAHAYSLLDSYIYGFALTKMNLPFETSETIGDVAEAMLQPFPVDEYPNLIEFLTEHVMKPGYDYADEFDHGLEAILEGLERMRDVRATERPSEGRRQARRRSSIGPDSKSD
jgi:AcrR family transcriptional regulator